MSQGSDTAVSAPTEPRRILAAYERRYSSLEGDPIAQFECAKEAATLHKIEDAIHHVVDAYQNGVGVEPSRSSAFEWMRLAAVELRFDSFYYDLALAYRDGDGTTQDIARFWEWMTKAAALQDPEAMFQLADAHQRPEFGPISAERSADWTLKMAELGSPGAMIQLARRFRDADGVKKDSDQVFHWATKAVTEAEAILNSFHDERDNWTYEDYPEALAMLAEAHRLKGNQQEARGCQRNAALAAASAMHSAIENKHKAGQRLAELMLEVLPQLKTKSGTVRASDAAQYFEWLFRIDVAVQRIHFSEDGANAMPPKFAEAIFDLAIAYRDGTGTKRSKVKFREHLERAASADHGEALYLLAMTAYGKNELLTFTQFVASAAAANHMNAQIAHALSACGLPKKQFLATLEALENLRETVDNIRKTRHALQPEEAKIGIAHYTDGHALESMLGNDSRDAVNRIRLYNIAYVNDPKEGQRLRSFSLEDGSNPLRALFDSFSGKNDAIAWQDKELLVFIACFSLERDSLNLWRFYGRDGAGYSVVSPYEAFDADASYGILRGAWTKQLTTTPQVTLYKVLYDDKSARKALQELANPLMQIASVSTKLSVDAATKLRRIAAAIVSELLYLYKDADFSEEREVRAVEARSLGDPELKQQAAAALAPFAKLYVETRALLFEEVGSAVVIGPKVANKEAVMIDIQHRLARKSWSACTVSQSTVPYR